MTEKFRVRVYTTNICGYCRAAKRLLEQRGIPFEEINLSNDPVLRQKLVDQTGWRTVPLIQIDDELVGGFTELVALDKAGELTAYQEGSEV